MHIGAVIDEVLHNSDPLFRELFPNTELGIDLKLLTRKPGRMHEGANLKGTLTRDEEYHYTFTQDLAPKGTQTARNTMVYRGACINLHQNDLGERYPTFCRPHFSALYTLSDFLREAAEELEYVARLVEKSPQAR